MVLSDNVAMTNNTAKRHRDTFSFLLQFVNHLLSDSHNIYIHRGGAFRLLSGKCLEPMQGELATLILRDNHAIDAGGGFYQDLVASSSTVIERYPDINATWLLSEVLMHKTQLPFVIESMVIILIKPGKAYTHAYRVNTGHSIMIAHRYLQLPGGPKLITQSHIQIFFSP